MKNYPKTVVCLGDSITCEWNSPSYVSYWKKKLEEDSLEVKFINAGVNGETAQDGYYRLERDVLSHKPELVTIMFGHNEIGRGLSIDTFENYLNLIIQKISYALPQTKMWILSPNKVSHPIKQDLYKELLERLSFPDQRFDFVNIWECFEDSDLEDYYTLKMNAGADQIRDFIHPNQKGHKVIGHNLASVYKKKFM